MGTFGAFSWRLIFWPKCEILVNIFYWKTFRVGLLRSWKLHALCFLPSNLVVLSWSLLGTLLWPPCPSWEHFVHFLGRLIFWPNCEIFCDICNWKMFRVGRLGSKSKMVSFPSNLVVLSWYLSGDSPVTPLPLMGTFGAFLWSLIFLPICEILRDIFIGKRSELERLGSKS